MHARVCIPRWLYLGVALTFPPETGGGLPTASSLCPRCHRPPRPGSGFRRNRTQKRKNRSELDRRGEVGAIAEHTIGQQRRRVRR